MDSSNAEKRETVAERAWREHPDEMARAHTELQVGVLREQLAAAEAVIEKVRALPRQRVWYVPAEKLDAALSAAPWLGIYLSGIYLSESPWYVPAEKLDAALSAAPSLFLAAVKAVAWDEGYGGDLEATTPRTNPYRTGDTNA